MIINIPVDEQKSIDFDTANPPLNSAFEELLQLLSYSDVPADVQHKIAYSYRKHPDLARKILKQLEDRCGGDHNTQLLLLACQLQLGINSVELIQKIEPLSSPVFDILKGFLSLRRKSYDSALFLFKKARFRLGVQICNYYLNNLDEARKSDNGIIRAYCLIKESRDGKEVAEAVELFKREGKKDILFRLGFSDEYSDGESMDVRITLAERSINEGRFKEAGEMMERIPQNAETLYLKGKLEHMCGNLEKAKRYFMESLEHDRNYFKSSYNLQRIMQDDMGECSYPSSEFSNFKAYLKLKKKDMDVNLQHCSEEFRNVASAIIEGKKRTSKGLGRYLKLIGNPLIENFVVLNNISYFLCRYMKPFSDDSEENKDKGKDRFLIGSTGMKNEDAVNYVFEGVCRSRRDDAERYLSKALEECPDEYKDVIRYNLAYVMEDEKTLMESPLKEARLVIANKIEGDNGFLAPTELELLGYYHVKRKEFKLAKKIFQKLDTPYACIVLGNIYIRSFYKDKDSSMLSKAMKTFSRNLQSYYCANGIGICLALSGRLEESVDVFSSVSVDCIDGYINLGNALVLCGRYREAIAAFLKVSSMEYSQEMLVEICKLTKSVECCKLCVSGGVTGLKEYLFELLVEGNCLDEAEKLGVKDERLLEIYRERRETEERKQRELKRKMDEINEYRKKRNT